ncbi:hypothetical protein YTPLAS18_08600 [Nitrospira sp.]|nr:hypothetical protein YTPLAS18_08600 [Nitrospira sp.]
MERLNLFLRPTKKVSGEPRLNVKIVTHARSVRTALIHRLKSDGDAMLIIPAYHIQRDAIANLMPL